MLSTHDWRTTPTGQAPPPEPPRPPGTPLTLADVERAKRRSPLAPTPLVSHPQLSTLLGAETMIKLENAQPFGAFKIRGGLELLATLSDRERSKGLVTATRGNHGQSLAHACARHGVGCTIFVPRGNSRNKNRAMRGLGSTLVEEGADFDAAWAAATRHADRTGARLIHPGREKALLAGVGTMALEILEQAATLDAIFVPVGVGSCIAATATVFSALSPTTDVIGVQSRAAPAMTYAWRGDDPPAHPPLPSLADGLAVGVPVHETLSVMNQLVDDMVIVDEEEIARAMRWYASILHQMAEGAGAAALAGAYAMRHRYRGGRVAVILSGGNVEMDALRRVIAG